LTNQIGQKFVLSDMGAGRPTDAGGQPPQSAGPAAFAKENSRDPEMGFNRR
jgi:hypothetical protein